MTPAEVLSEAARVGLVLRAEGDRIIVRPARLLPPTLADRIRANRDEILAALAKAPACYACNTPLGVDTDLLCPQCFSTRRGLGRVLPFDPDFRRRRAAARLAGRPCPDCLTVTWLLTERGDAVCRTCAATRREEA